ncbi:MAG TPA: lipid-A-disaccharide synthase [Pyrinomonadaceae bacterium]|nr:lipid-A-disaccharide synthase [Pyrinomonadaceae bacterium]
MPPHSRQIMIVSGEASGDLHAAKLVRAIRECEPDTNFQFFGSAGPNMREAGVEPVVYADNLSIVGLPEIGRALPMFLRAYQNLKRAAIERRADVVILVDFPDFNLKLAKSLKKKGLTVIYYISPQLWAWRKYRKRTIKKYVDLLITILPFEKDWYAGEGITHVEYVGSPLAREVVPNSSSCDFRHRHKIKADTPLVSLLPGSRHKEIVRILPVMLDAAAELKKQTEELEFIVAIGSDKHSDDVRSIIASRSNEGLRVISGETYDVLNASDAAAITSGTATLEAGIIGTPMAIVYKTSPLNYKLLRPLISVEHFGLINLIAGERVANEFIQDDFTPRTLSDELRRLLDPEENSHVRSKLRAATDKLGHGGASKRAAESIFELLSKR